MYGATSFVGVVHVLHFPAGQASNTADLALGTYGSARGSAAFALPEWHGYRQSFAASAENIGFADAREKISNGQLLYRGALNLGAGELRIDTNVSIVRDVPPSPVIRQGTALTTLTPLNANFNPADATIAENKYQLALGYSLPTTWGTWDTLASVSRSTVTDIRAFLHPDLSGAADTQNQNRLILDDYFDTHLASHFAESTLVVGADLLYGYGSQTTNNGNSAYTVPLDGSVVPPPTTQLPVNEYGSVSDKRLFAGQYVQVDWKPAAPWDIVAGIRLNETNESKTSSDLTLPTFTPTEEYAAQAASRDQIRPTETLGASYRLWARRGDQAVLFADWRNAFKPSALDFGPDYQPAVLLPETARMYEMGLRGAAVEGRAQLPGGDLSPRLQQSGGGDGNRLPNQCRLRAAEGRSRSRPGSISGMICWLRRTMRITTRASLSTSSSMLTPTHTSMLRANSCRSLHGIWSRRESYTRLCEDLIRRWWRPMSANAFSMRRTWRSSAATRSSMPRSAIGSGTTSYRSREPI